MKSAKTKQCEVTANKGVKEHTLVNEIEQAQLDVEVRFCILLHVLQ